MPGVLEWPAMFKKNRVIDIPVGGLDFYPTFAAMLGVTSKAVGPLDGEDIMPILKGEAKDRKRGLPVYVNPEIPGEKGQKGKGKPAPLGMD